MTAAKKPVAPVPEVPEVPPKDPPKAKAPVKGSTKVKVKNIGKTTVYMTHGKIKSGGQGIATVAELQCHSAVIEKV